MLLCFVYRILFSPVLSLKKLFLNMDLVMISFESCFIIKDIWFPLVNFGFIVAKLFAHVLHNRCSPLSLWTISSLERLFIKSASLDNYLKHLWFIVLGLIFLKDFLMAVKVISQNLTVLFLLHKSFEIYAKHSSKSNQCTYSYLDFCDKSFLLSGSLNFKF